MYFQNKKYDKNTKIIHTVDKKKKNDANFSPARKHDDLHALHILQSNLKLQLPDKQCLRGS